MTSSVGSEHPALWAKEQWSALPVHRSILSPLMFLERTLHVFPEAIGVVDGDRRFTYAEFAARVYRLASALRRRGVGNGDRVALLCQNATEVLEAHFAVPQIGAILTPINIRLELPTRSATSSTTPGAMALIVDAELAPLVAPLRPGLHGLTLVIRVDRAGAPPMPARAGWAGLRVAAGRGDGRSRSSIRLTTRTTPISINYTSGTTGRPKGVMYTHRGAYLNALGESLEVGLTQRQRLSLDAADVPLQRLVLSLGGRRRWADAGLLAASSSRPASSG